MRRLLSPLFIILDFTRFFLYLIKNWKIDAKGIVFVDIDNTVADTWPSLVGTAKLRRRSDLLRMKSLKPIKSSVKLVEMVHSLPVKLVFLSARPAYAKNVSLKWIERTFRFRSRGDFKGSPDVILVSSPVSKIFYWLSYHLRGIKTCVIDDLSYGQERGECNFYSLSRNTLLAFGVPLISYEVIQTLRGHSGEKGITTFHEVISELRENVFNHNR
jgi:hypothetical protein